MFDGLQRLSQHELMQEKGEIILARSTARRAAPSSRRDPYTRAVAAMPDGACVIKYAGKRGVVWRVKFKDADGRQVTETLGRADAGWTKRTAEAALRNRLADVERLGLKRPQPTTFATFASRWLDGYPAATGLKRSTRSKVAGTLPVEATDEAAAVAEEVA
jgi:hypothetical protein